MMRGQRTGLRQWKSKCILRQLIVLSLAVLLVMMQPLSYVSAEGEGSAGIQDVNINITSYTIEPGTVSAGSSFKVNFTVQKDGSQNIKDGSVYVTFNTPEGISYTGSSTKMKLSGFSNSQATAYQAEFEAAAELTGGKKNIGMTFSYVYTDGDISVPGTSEGMVRVPVQAVAEPKLSITGVPQKTSVKANQSGKLSFSFKNESPSIAIQNLTADYAVSDGLSLTGGSSAGIDNIKAGESKTQTVSVRALKSAEEKQSVTFTYTYEYTVGSQTLTVTGEKTVGVSVVSSSSNAGQPYLILDKYDYGGTKAANTSFTLSARFKNSGKAVEMKNVVITMEPDEGLVLTDASNKIMLKKLAGGKTVTKNIHLRTANDATTGYKSVNFKITYEYESGGEMKEAETSAVANISVQGKEENQSAATPNIMISSYDYGKKVAAGSEFKLHMEVKNTSAAKDIENIVVSMAMPEDLTIASSSNTFYIRSLSAGAVFDYDIKLQALSTAKAMSSAITLNFVYEYVDGEERKQVTSEEQISIPIYQPDRLSAELAAQESEIYAGNEATVSVAYVNKGKGTLYNVEALIETDADVLESKQNLGNFDAGSNGSIEFYVTAYEPGTLDGTITINYEDENMEVKTVEIPFSYDVFEAEEMEAGYYEEDFFGDMGEGEEETDNSGNKKILLVILIVLAVIIVIVIIIVIVKKIKKKRQLRIQQLEDMMDEEDE